MPYFIICPIYAVMFLGLLLLAGVLAFTKQFRRWSSYLVAGALGTLPGFIIGNVLFWLIAWGFFTVLQKPLQQVSSDVVNGAAAMGLVIVFVGGLGLANVAGCAAGFLGGIWIRSKFRGQPPPGGTRSPSPPLPNPRPPA
jgi:hypothetical protein